MVHLKNTILTIIIYGLKPTVTIQEVLINSLESRKAETNLFLLNVLVWQKLWMVDTLCHADQELKAVTERVNGERQ